MLRRLLRLAPALVVCAGLIPFGYALAAALNEQWQIAHGTPTNFGGGMVVAAYVLVLQLLSRLVILAAAALAFGMAAANKSRGWAVAIAVAVAVSLGIIIGILAEPSRFTSWSFSGVPLNAIESLGFASAALPAPLVLAYSVASAWTGGSGSNAKHTAPAGPSAPEPAAALGTAPAGEAAALSPHST